MSARSQVLDQLLEVEAQLRELTAKRNQLRAVVLGESSEAIKYGDLGARILEVLSDTPMTTAQIAKRLGVAYMTCYAQLTRRQSKLVSRGLIRKTANGWIRRPHE